MNFLHTMYTRDFIHTIYATKLMPIIIYKCAHTEIIGIYIVAMSLYIQMVQESVTHPQVVFNFCVTASTVRQKFT